MTFTSLLSSTVESLYYSTTGVTIIVFTIALAIFYSRSKRPRVTTDGGYTPSVSIVIPTYNEASIIVRKLENVVLLDYPSDQLEILVVDSASNDGTPSLVQKFAEEHRREVRTVLIEQPVRRGKSEAINDALLHVRSEIIVLTDADVTFRPDSVRTLVENFHRKGVGAVSGVEVPVGGKSFLSRIEADYRQIYTSIRLAEAETDAPFMCESELSAYRRDLLDPLRPGTVCDDVELTIMVRSKGYEALYASEVPFFETEAGDLGPKLHHKLRRGMNNQHALLQNSNVFFNRRFGRYGRVVFPFEFFVHIVSPVLFSIAAISLIGLIVLSPDTALIAVFVSALASIPSLVILGSLVKKFHQRDVAGLYGTRSWILGAATFLAFQFVLFVGLLKLLGKGPQTNWQQVRGTRVPITVIASG